MAGHLGMGAMPDPAGAAAADPGWITGVNWFWTGFFAVAAVILAYRYFDGRRQHRSAAPELSADDAGVLGQAMMAAGMAIMFAVML